MNRLSTKRQNSSARKASNGSKLATDDRRNKANKLFDELLGDDASAIGNDKEKTKAEVSPSQVILKDELNKVGSYKVILNFHSEVKSIITIKIDKIQSK